MNKFHEPVLLEETLAFLKVKRGERYIDATVGGGGHARKILEKGGILLGIDFDPEAIDFTRKCLVSACPPSTFLWSLAQGNFAKIVEIARKEGFEKVEGIIFDLGVSSWQVDSLERGFSFRSKTALDMRMNPDLQVSAKDLINGLTKGELKELFFKLAEEGNPTRIVNEICESRKIKPIETGEELAKIIARAYRSRRKEKIHPATRFFQALRIAVNDELNNLRQALPEAVSLLRKGGRLVVISFHGLEDRIVKDFFKSEEGEGLKTLTFKPVIPSWEEVERNPRSRSAKLRAAEKI